jgi:hypothetical protein
MKKAVLVLAVVLLVTAFFPQEAAAKIDFTLGLRAGVSMSNISWSDDDGTEHSLVKPTFGLVGAFPLSQVLAIQAEIDYVTMGEWWEEEPWKTIETYNYLQIPVLLRAHLVRGGSTRPFLLAGPVVGFLMSAHHKDYFNGELDDDTDATEYHSSTDFGAAFGAGTDFMVKKLKLFVDIRYYLGLSNTYSDSEMFSMKTRALLFAAGIWF